MPQSSNTRQQQEGTFYFHLTPQQATDIAMNRDMRNPAKPEYLIQVQLRFCLLETTSEQEDNFPSNVTVKVNGKPCQLPVSIDIDTQTLQHVLKFKLLSSESNCNKQAWR